MAILIPQLSKTNEFDTKGEKLLYELLSQLSDEFTILYNPKIEDLPNIDFLVLCKLGMLVIEVKDWSLNFIKSYSETEILLADDRTDENPVKTSQHRSFELANKITKYSYKLKNSKGKFIAAYSGVAFYANMVENDLTKKLPYGPRNTPTTLFRANHTRKIICKDTLNTDSIENLILSSFQYNFLTLSKVQINLIVDLIFDKKYVKFLFDDTIIALDCKQYELATKLDMNQYVIIGAAGTGKTVLLIARAIYLSENYPNHKILISSNKQDSLKIIEQSLLNAGLSSDKFTFTSQAHINKVGNKKFDVVLIDEMQDFTYENILILKNLLFNPISNHFIGFTDCAQNSSNIKEYNLKNFGTLYYLKLCYRNKPNIFKYAKKFILNNSSYEDSSKDCSYYENTKTLSISNGNIEESNFIISYNDINLDYCDLKSFFNNFFPENIFYYQDQEFSLSDIAILTIGSDNINNRIFKALDRHSISHKETITSTPDDAITVLPHVTSKGSEFKIVFVLISPYIKNIETSLLIASTRAKEYLHIVRYTIK